MIEQTIIWIVIILAGLYTGKKFINHWNNASQDDAPASGGCSCSGCSDSGCDKSNDKTTPEKL
jgi:hypothetical protein